MRRVLFGAAFALLFAGFAPTANAQAFRTGPEANKYLFMFYAIDDMTREFSPAEIEQMKKRSEATVYADHLGALYTKRRMTLNSFRRHAEIVKLDKGLYDAVEETDGLMKAVGSYYEKLKEAQNAYDLGFRSIQAKLFTDAELRDKLLQKFIDAESYYLKVVDAPNRNKSDYTMRGITRSLKRRAVAEYQLAKNRQKLAEDVHAACLRYEAEHRPALEAKIETIHRDFAADYEKVHKQAIENITAKFKPLAQQMGLSQTQVVMIGGRTDVDLTKEDKERPRDPFRMLAAARTMKLETQVDAKKAHEFSRELIKAIEWVPIGSARDTTEVFYYYRGLLSGWAGTLATKAAAIQLGSESLQKAYANPPEAASTAMYAWSCYKQYEASGAFSRAHYINHYVTAHAYQGRVQEGLKLAKDASGDRIEDPNYWYILARMCGVYKYGNKANIEKFYEEGIGHMREAMLLGFTGVEEARISPDLENIRRNSKLAAKLNQAMFEPDNLWKLAKLDKDARKQ
jgi:hypothetical protein